MSKRKQSQTKKNNAKTSVDTNKKKKHKKKQIFLPYTLRGKKLKKFRLSTNKYLPGEEDLEQYLKTGEMEYLFDAIKKDNKLLLEAGCGRDLVLEGVLRNNPSHKNLQPDSIYVDPLTIVGEVIRALQSKCVFRLGEFITTSQGRVYKIDEKATEKVTKEAKRYLKRISPLLVPDRKAWEEIGKAGLIHRKPYKVKGGTSSFSYLSAPIFIQYWNSIREAVRKSKLKRRYNDNKQDRALLIQHLAEELPKYLDVDMCPFPDEIKEFNLKTTRLITASFIAWRHKLSCPLCKRRNKDLSPETVDDLYKRAKEELKESQ